MAVVIALLGAECSGKTSLAQALTQRLNAQGLSAQAVPEYLRQWCDQHQRTPLAHEQLHIAHTQSQRIERASAQAHVVLADTSALMTAVYSALYFNDHSLMPYALAQQQRYQAQLLMGLDLPWQAGDWQRDGPARRDQADALLRQTLSQANLSFGTVYGSGPQRVDAAVSSIQDAISLIASCDLSKPASGQFGLKNSLQKTPEPWVWVCDKCSDPDCEHRLLASLQTSRQAKPAP